MTTPVQMKRPEGDAAKHYADALRLERETAEAVEKWDLEKAERLRGQARESWQKYRETSAACAPGAAA